MPLKWEHPKCQEKKRNKERQSSTQGSFSRLEENKCLLTCCTQFVSFTKHHFAALPRNTDQRAAYAFYIHGYVGKVLRNILPTLRNIVPILGLYLID